MSQAGKRNGPPGQRGAALVTQRDPSEAHPSYPANPPSRKDIDGRTEVILARRRRERSEAEVVALSVGRINALRRIANHHGGNSTNSQHRRLLRAFAGGPLTVIDAREHLDILAFHARVAGLQAQGHRFARRWVLQVTGQGHGHRVVQIALTREGDTG